MLSKSFRQACFSSDRAITLSFMPLFPSQLQQALPDQFFALLDEFGQTRDIPEISAIRDHVRSQEIAVTPGDP